MDKIDSFMGEYRWLSNYHVCDIYYDGIIYQSTEHAYQAAKTLDKTKRLEFLKLTCSGAKRRGNKLKLRSDWEEIKLKVMYDVNYYKYTRHAELGQKLIDTGDIELIEWNSWNDIFWGKSIETGEGSNNLGIILMKIRKEILDMIH